MNALRVWWRQRHLSPSAARIEYLERLLRHRTSELQECLAQCDYLERTNKTLHAALLAAQFDAEGWRAIARQQSTQRPPSP